jgi:hypothetical protein
MKLRYLDTCLPDYFAGFGGETFAVPLHDGITNAEVLEGLHGEIRGWSGYYGGEQATEADFKSLHASADHEFAEILDNARNGRWSQYAGDECYAYFGVLVEELA